MSLSVSSSFLYISLLINLINRINRLISINLSPNPISRATVHSTLEIGLGDCQPSIDAGSHLTFFLLPRVASAQLESKLDST